VSQDNDEEENENMSKTVFVDRIRKGDSVEEATEKAKLVGSYVEENTIDGWIKRKWKEFKGQILGALGTGLTLLGLALQEKIEEFFRNLF